MTKLNTAYLSLLVATAFAATATAAQAEPYWTSNGKVIHVRTDVATSGPITIHALGTAIKCKLTDKEVIENPSDGDAGIDEFLSFTLECSPKPTPCPGNAKVEVIVNTPLQTHLIDEKPPIRDVIENVKMEVLCNKVLLEAYTGELKPELKNSALIFGAGSGELENAITHKVATLTGTDHLLGAKANEKIGAEDVAFAPHWYSNGKRIAEGVKETVKTSGTLTSHVPGGEVKCNVADVEEVVNPAGGAAGTDVVTSYTTGKCAAKPACPPGTKLEVIGKTPWFSELIPGSPIRDEIKGVTIEVNCVGPGGTTATFTGALTPEVGNSALVFGPGSGSLTGPGGIIATITGSDALKGPAGDTKITAETP